MFEDFISTLKGYDKKQELEAKIATLYNFLATKGIIDIQEYFKFAEENEGIILKKIIDRDRNYVTKGEENENN